MSVVNRHIGAQNLLKIKNESSFGKPGIPSPQNHSNQENYDIGSIRPAKKSFSLSNDTVQKYDSHFQKKVFYKPSAVSNAFVQNNQKQSQRRKLLFEYGLEQKLHNQNM